MGSAMTGWCPLLRSGVYVDDVSQKFLTYNVHFFVWNAHIENSYDFDTASPHFSFAGTPISDTIAHKVPAERNE